MAPSDWVLPALWVAMPADEAWEIPRTSLYLLLEDLPSLREVPLLTYLQMEGVGPKRSPQGLHPTPHLMLTHLPPPQLNALVSEVSVSCSLFLPFIKNL